MNMETSVRRQHECINFLKLILISSISPRISEINLFDFDFDVQDNAQRYVLKVRRFSKNVFIKRNNLDKWSEWSSWSIFGGGCFGAKL